MKNLAKIIIFYNFCHSDGQNNPSCSPPTNNDNWFYTKTTEDPSVEEGVGVWYYVSESKADIYSFDQFCLSMNSTMGKVLTSLENDFLQNTVLVDSKNAWLGGHFVLEPDNNGNETDSAWYWFNNVDSNQVSAGSLLIDYFKNVRLFQK